MKTAIQELIDELDLVKIIDKHNFYMVKYIIEQCLKKEKEQIIDAFIQGGEQWNSEDASVIYYNQTYNQNNNL